MVIQLTADEVRAHVAASPQTLYDMVADVRRTPEWSSEVVSCGWLDGADRAVVGARFRARNRIKWFTWSNEPVIVTAEPGREIAWSRTERGGGTMVWRYRFEPAATGTTVVQSYDVTDPVPLMLSRVLRLVFGVRDHRAHLRAGMEGTLQRLKAAAEEGHANATAVEEGRA